MDKKNLAIIGASYLQLPLIKKAKEMGFETHVFAWEAGDVGESEADHFYPISIKEVDAITNKCREIGICGICSVATDLGNYTVNYVANELGLPCNSMESTRKSTNKHLMRKAFFENSDPSPRSILIDDKSDLKSKGLTYPLIVKPTDRSGSRGITKIENEKDLKKAIEEALKESFEKKALLEEFAEGKEYSVEGISFKGEHHILAVTEKFTTGAPHFIETGHMEPADIDEDTFKRVSEIVKHALDSLEIKNSASHSEIKIDKNGEIKIIEIGARMGGDCIGSDLVYYSTGIDYLRAVIQVACGEEPDLAPCRNRIKVKIKYYLTQMDVLEFEKLKKESPSKIIKQISFLPKNIGSVTNSSNRGGCYLVKIM